MVIKYSHIGLLIVFFFSGALLAQNKKDNKLFGFRISENLINPENGLIRCASTEYDHYLQSKYASRATEQQFEEWISPKTDEIKRALKTKKFNNDTLIIPVVVHIIHSEKAIGEKENISDKRVRSQITVLNQDYMRMINTPGYNNNPIGAYIGIKFKLAKVDPKGKVTNGIDRVSLSGYTWNTDNVEKILKPKTQWNPNKYFNIWVCEFGGDTGDLKGVLGYAQFPSASQLEGLKDGNKTAKTDGVIIDWRAFGTSDIAGGTYFAKYNKGRTLTHEIGHSLGLRHVWGDNNDCFTDATDSHKDYCPDTPVSSQANYSCNTIIDSCPKYPKQDMTENYMDYTEDACLNTFTLDQKARILTVLKNSPRRASLLRSEVWKSWDGENMKSETLLYPNPVSDELNVTFTDIDRVATSYKIFTPVGTLILKDTVDSSSEFQINTSNLSPNVYILKIQTNKGVAKLKFIVQQ